MKELGYGKDYLYPPDHGFAPGQTYLPPELSGQTFFSSDEEQKPP